jgi:putative membrane protein
MLSAAVRRAAGLLVSEPAETGRRKLLIAASKRTSVHGPDISSATYPAAFLRLQSSCPRAILPRVADPAAMTFADVLPPLNACLNGLSALLLFTGFLAIRRGHRRLHARLMVAAFVTSSLFLVSYLTRFALTGTHYFPGTGFMRGLYLFILSSHMILAIAVVPLAVRTLWLSAYRKRFDAHRRIARWTFPIWMYVSVTGVVVYFLLYHYPG